VGAAVGKAKALTNALGYAYDLFLQIYMDSAGIKLMDKKERKAFFSSRLKDVQDNKSISRGRARLDGVTISCLIGMEKRLLNMDEIGMANAFRFMRLEKIKRSNESRLVSSQDVPSQDA
jgi:hypothetical protein